MVKLLADPHPLDHADTITGSGNRLREDRSDGSGCVGRQCEGGNERER
jgi:hypothetical protein